MLGDRGRGWEAAVSAAEAEGSLDLRLRARAEDLGPAPSPGPILPVRSGWEEPQQLTCLPRSAQGRQPGQSHDGNQTCWLDAQSRLPLQLRGSDLPTPQITEGPCGPLPLLTGPSNAPHSGPQARRGVRVVDPCLPLPPAPFTVSPPWGLLFSNTCCLTHLTLNSRRP